MSTPHNAANPGDIAKVVLMPGDPLRAKFVADNYLTDVTCFTQVRNMYGFTGTYEGKRISVMGSGMGVPSMAIYSYELFHFYGVDPIIRTMPGSYDMVLSSGASNVSQGERQLLTIARALVADPEVMILDEATSNVDARTEQLIQEAMAQLLKGRTSFVIAHRLSTIRDADKILYMEHGDILETGTHDELMAQHGRYEALYNSQFA